MITLLLSMASFLCGLAFSSVFYDADLEFSHRPKRENWMPIANCSPPDDEIAYRRAAKKLGLKIKISYPVPCLAGADQAARRHMKGIYLQRSQANMERQLMDEYFEQKQLLST